MSSLLSPEDVSSSVSDISKRKHSYLLIVTTKTTLQKHIILPPKRSSTVSDRLVSEESLAPPVSYITQNNCITNDINYINHCQYIFVQYLSAWQNITHRCGHSWLSHTFWFLYNDCITLTLRVTSVSIRLRFSGIPWKMLELMQCKIMHFNNKSR